MTGADKTKLDGVAAGAEVNVNADWNSGAGDSQILNKPSTFAPSAHATNHKSGGSDAIKLDELAAPTDVMTLDASLTAHGLMQKYPGGTSNFLRSDGAFAIVPGGSEAFPVGSVFIAVVSTNPGTLLGYGTWSAFAAGRVLVGLDAGQTEFDVVEETGGAKTHVLSSAEMPAHTHVQNAHQHNISHVRSATTGGASTNIAQTIDTSSTLGTATLTDNATPVNQNTGGDGAHNNLQPYIVVYMWKRTA
jgi:microcystin-dependent protein